MHDKLAITALAIKPKLAYPEPEAAALLGISPRTLFAERKAGRIAFVKIGERVLYRASALRAYLRDNETPAVEMNCGSTLQR